MHLSKKYCFRRNDFYVIGKKCYKQSYHFMLIGKIFPYFQGPRIKNVLASKKRAYLILVKDLERVFYQNILSFWPWKKVN